MAQLNKISDLKNEKERLRKLADEQVKDIKESLHMVKDEGKHVLIKKVLIPVGVGVVAGYGLKKLIDFIQSDKDERNNTEKQDHRSIQDEKATNQNNQKDGLFSNVDWAAMAVRATPFILSVGKKLYEDGNLPFFNPPGDSTENR